MNLKRNLLLKLKKIIYYPYKEIIKAVTETIYKKIDSDFIYLVYALKCLFQNFKYSELR